MTDLGRRKHYAQFYGDAPVEHIDADQPLVVVVGNCQAESLRVLLAGPGAPGAEGALRDGASARVRTVRVPPVFEWTGEDVAAAGRLLARADALVTQPIRDDYRGLPSGTRQLEALLPPSGRSVRVPALRYAGLHPYQVIVRDPADSSLDPPVVPYHDLRTMAEALAGRSPDDGPLWPRRPLPELSREALRRGHAESVDQLRRRERAHGTVEISDVLEDHPHWHTVNHPDNSTLMALARRTLSALGLQDEVAEPGRELLRSIEAPVDPEHAQALGARLRPEARHRGWRIGLGPAQTEADEMTVAREQLAFCAQRPALLDHALQRHGQRMRFLGLVP